MTEPDTSPKDVPFGQRYIADPPTPAYAINNILYLLTRRWQIVIQPHVEGEEGSKWELVPPIPVDMTEAATAHGKRIPSELSLVVEDDGS